MCYPFADEKTALSDNKSAISETKSETTKSETSSAEQQPDKPKAPSASLPEFPPNPFDFSAMTGLLNVCQLLSCLKYIQFLNDYHLLSFHSLKF